MCHTNPVTEVEKCQYLIIFAISEALELILGIFYNITQNIL